MTAADTWCNWLWQGIPTVIEKRTKLIAWIRLNFTLQTSWVALNVIVRESHKDLWQQLTKCPLFYESYRAGKIFSESLSSGPYPSCPLELLRLPGYSFVKGSFRKSCDIYLLCWYCFLSPIWHFPFSSSPLFNLRWHRQALSIMAWEGRGGARCVLNKYFMEIVELV